MRQLTPSDQSHNTYLAKRSNGLISETLLGLLREFGVSVVGIAKFGLDLGPVVSGITGLEAVFDAGRELRNPAERFTNIYDTRLTADQKKDVDEQLTDYSGRSWKDLTPQERDKQWQDGLFRIYVNQKYLHDDYTLLLRHLPPITSLP